MARETSDMVHLRFRFIRFANDLYIANSVVLRSEPELQLCRDICCCLPASAQAVAFYDACSALKRDQISFSTEPASRGPNVQSRASTSGTPSQSLHHGDTPLSEWDPAFAMQTSTGSTAYFAFALQLGGRLLHFNSSIPLDQRAKMR